jgi:hexosaminidase
MKLKYTLIAMITGLLFSEFSKGQQTVVHLMPWPQKIIQMSGNFSLTASVKVAYQGSPDERIPLAIERFIQKAKQATGLTLQKSNFFSEAQIQIVRKPIDIANEGYVLDVRPTLITLTGTSAQGILHGLETLSQLIHCSDAVPLVHIEDWPAFAWRGMMVDVARHFIPLEVMKRNVEAMAAAKYNVLHLHLSDDEGFRIESRRYPKLHEKGSNGQYYTQAEIRDLVQFCSDRDIMVYPEFDLPGHCQSWFAGYPGLASEEKAYAPGPRFKTDASQQLNLMNMMQFIQTYPTASIDPTRESTYQFLDSLVAEMKDLFPSGYFHMGMDENNGIAWNNNPQIVEFMKANNIENTHALQNYFMKRFHRIITGHGLKSVAWEEAFNESSTPADMIIQVWQPTVMGLGVEIESLSKHGNPGILSRGFYLDQFYPAYIHYHNDEMNNTRWLGGEAAIWTEIVDGQVFEGRVWPRAMAIGERLWTNPSAQDTIADTDVFYQRLFHTSRYLKMTGLQHLDLQEKALADASSFSSMLEVLAPVKGYKRLMEVMLIPEEGRSKGFNQLADVLPPDPEEALKFRLAVSAYLKNKDVPSKEFVISYLNKWAKLAEVNSLTATEQPLADLAAKLAACSRNITNYLSGNSTLSREQLLAFINEIKKPVKGLEIAIGQELEALVTGQLKERPKQLPLF